MKTIACAASVIAIAGASLNATAQNYPDRPIRFVVNFPPGGSTDFTARILAQHLPAVFGQTVVVDNRGGGGGNIGADIVAKAAPDGYTFLLSAEGPITINPSVYTSLSYNAIRDIPAVTQLIKYANVVAVHPGIQVNAVKDLIARAKSQPGKLRYSHPGVGTGNHLVVELFKMMTGTDITSVPYKGGGPAVVAIIGNETQLSFATPPSALPHVKSGRLKAIAVTSAKRSVAMPDLPTVAESGVPGFAVDGWVGMYAPAGSPPRALERMHTEAVKILRRPDVTELVLAGGSEVGAAPIEESRKIVRDETAMWAKVVKSTGVKVE